MNDRDNPEAGSARLDRRRVLAVFGTGAAALAGALGCGARRSPPAPVEVELAEIERAGRLRVLHGENPVELRVTGDGIVARSLWCTHFGCEVRWVGGQRRYLCPCHEGVFDERGAVVAGPPPRPLATYPIEVNGSRVLVGVEPGASSDR